MPVPFPQAVMLARTGSTVPAANALRGGCVYEPKWDGYRGLVFVSEGGARVQSRRGADLTWCFPDVAAAAADQMPAGTVLDGELVIWAAGGLDFRGLQRRLTAGRRRVVELAATQPATFMAFDVLEDAGVDVRPEPLRRRRARLEQLMTAARPPLQLTPQTGDRAVALTWMEDYARAAVGIEGLVVKGKADPYQPDQRGWVKAKTRETVEALVGAVVGSLDAPRRLVLGRIGEDGVLHVAGATGELTAIHRKELTGVLVAATSPHPWPTQLMLGWGGSRDKVEVVLIEPTVTVEVLADAARDAGRWRHVARYVRVRVEP